jgi:hypothetical protein
MTIEDSLRKIIREELLVFAEQMDGPRQEKTHVSSTDLMAALGISRGTLRRMMEQGCPYVCPGKNPRFNLADVKRYLDSKGATSGRA